MKNNKITKISFIVIFFISTFYITKVNSAFNADIKLQDLLIRISHLEEENINLKNEIKNNRKGVSNIINKVNKSVVSIVIKKKYVYYTQDNNTYKSPQLRQFNNHNDLLNFFLRQHNFTNNKNLKKNEKEVSVGGGSGFIY